MNKISRYQRAVDKIDEANSRDPNTDVAGEEEIPKELLYGRRMSEWLEKMEPDASEALKLAARGQHIERWVIPREEYPADRPGYLKWRNALKKYHAERMSEILDETGYEQETIRRVEDLVKKKGIKSDPEAQQLEDVICLVFLAYYFMDFSLKHDDDKLIEILKKTWRKMSERGRERAMKLEMPDRAQKLMEKALS